MYSEAVINGPLESGLLPRATALPLINHNPSLHFAPWCQTGLPHSRAPAQKYINIEGISWKAEGRKTKHTVCFQTATEA